jgi:hypothetical protein
MTNSKKTIQLRKLNQKLIDLKQALKEKSISVNEYSSMYYATYQQMKRL